MYEKNGVLGKIAIVGLTPGKHQLLKEKFEELGNEVTPMIPGTNCLAFHILMRRYGLVNNKKIFDHFEQFGCEDQDAKNDIIDYFEKNGYEDEDYIKFDGDPILDITPDQMLNNFIVGAENGLLDDADIILFNFLPLPYEKHQTHIDGYILVSIRMANEAFKRFPEKKIVFFHDSHGGSSVYRPIINKYVIKY